MALYKLAWRFAHDVTWPNRRKWSTTAYVDAPSAVAAAAAGVVGWTQLLRGGVNNTIFCYQVYATDLSPDTDNYVVQEIPDGSRRGTRNPADGEKYLTKAVATVEVLVAGSRPSRKFWRVGLTEGEVTNGTTLSPAVVSAVTAAFQNLVGEETFCDPDGQLYTGVGRITLGTREFGRTAGADVPEPPAVG